MQLFLLQVLLDNLFRSKRNNNKKHTQYQRVGIYWINIIFALSLALSKSVFGKHWIVRDIDQITAILFAIVAFVVAIFSWKYIELPFRKKNGVISRKPLFVGSLTVMLCFIGFSILIQEFDGWPARVSPQTLKMLSFKSYRNPRMGRCLVVPPKWISPSQTCVYGADAEPSYAVWGDSHADALIDMIGDVARQNGEAVRSLGANGCPPNRRSWPRWRRIQRLFQI